MIRMNSFAQQRSNWRSIASNQRGVTAVEMGFLFPIFLTFMVGMFDAGYYLYNRVQLDGAVAKAARDSSLESNIGTGSTAIDNRVKELMGLAAKNAEFTFSRQSYSNFNTALRLEPWTDTNANGTCDGGEPYEDINNSSSWDRGGKAGQGGAKDVVVYEVTMRYPRLMPTEKILGIDDEATIRARTLIANQPYAQQSLKQNTVRNCS